ncbi:MAG TPA: transglutaminase domain-containing protein [Candidatus Limnocylindrales bacterium]|jgi:transglutaminase-like putative cysteine protease
MTLNARDRLFRAPAEGWLSLLLVGIMAVAVAWSLDDAALVLGRGEWTDFLAWAAVGGVLVGFVGARAGWNRPVAHLLGAMVAGLVLPVLVGTVLRPGGTIPEQFQATSDSVANAVIDFAVRQLPVTRETGHFLLVLGILCWANGQFAASAIFRHGRSIGPIIVLGAVLVANMSATLNDEMWFLVMFTVAALLLLTRLHALDERATWLRRRIGDPAVVSSLYVRGGTAFVMVAVFFALALTATARSAPLAGFWDDLKPALVDVSQWLQRIIPAAPNSRSLGVPGFGDQVTIGGLWSTSDDPALEIDRKPGDNARLYWRAAAYDTFTLNGWTSSLPTHATRQAGSPILDGTLDAIPTSAARTTQQFVVRPLTSFFHKVFSPVDPVSVDRDTTLNMAGPDGFYQSIEIDGRDPYALIAAIPTEADIAGGLTNNRLRAAGTSYPPAVLARYLSVPSDALGPAAKALLKQVQSRAATAKRTTPFDIATEIVNELQSPTYKYSTNVLGVCAGEPSIVECFADHKTGYCEHYASTMVMLLREAKIPARLVEGFLPGKLDVATGKELIRTGAAHAWVEVYFPGYGWQLFDPTGGNVAQASPHPEGTVVPLVTPAPAPSFSFAPGANGDDVTRSRRPGSTFGGGSSQGGGGGATMIIVSIVLLATVLLLAFLAWRRGPRSASTPEGVYASVTGLARRFGFGPRPTQTAFEYATALGDVLPNVRPELQTVAAAKVEVAYGHRTLGDDRLVALRTSYQRLRVALLRLAFRRSDRRRLRRG